MAKAATRRHRTWASIRHSIRASVVSAGTARRASRHPSHHPIACGMVSVVDLLLLLLLHLRLGMHVPTSVDSCSTKAPRRFCETGQVLLLLLLLHLLLAKLRHSTSAS